MSSQQSNSDDKVDTGLKKVMQLAMNFAMTKLGPVGREELSLSEFSILSDEEELRDYFKQNGFTEFTLDGVSNVL